MAQAQHTKVHIQLNDGAGDLEEKDDKIPRTISQLTPSGGFAMTSADIYGTNKLLQAAKEAESKIPTNKNRYLHKVWFEMDTVLNKKKAAFLGWHPGTHVPHATIMRPGLPGADFTGMDMFSALLAMDSIRDRERRPDLHKGSSVSSMSTDNLVTNIPLTNNVDDAAPRLSASIATPEQHVLTNEKLFDQDQIDKFLANPKKYRYRRVVFIDFKLKRVSDIDTTRETFRAKFHFYLTWLATKQEFERYKEKGSKWEPKWIPDIEFVNQVDAHSYRRTSPFKIKKGDTGGYMMPMNMSLDDAKEMPWGNSSWDIERSQIGFDPRLGNWIRVKFDADMTFAEELELESFPFDCQDYTIYMKCENYGTDTCDLVPFPRKGDFMLLDPQFSVLAEWHLESVIVEFSHTSPTKSKALRTYPSVAIHVKASRTWTAHISTFLVTFCMFGLGMGAFAMGTTNEELGNRLSYCVTFLLADVATLQLMNHQLPNIPYLTLLDGYMYMCFIFLFAVTIWSCMTAPYDGKFAGWDDNMAYIFMAIFFAIQIIFLTTAYRARHVEKTKLKMTDEELEQYFNERTSICAWGPQSNAGKRESIAATWNREEFLDIQSDSKTLVACAQELHTRIQQRWE